MLDQKVTELTDGLIQAEFAERRQQLDREILSTAQEFNSRGLLHSGGHVQRVTEICHREAEIRAWFVYNTHIRVLTQLSVDPYPELSGDLKGRLSYFFSLGDDYAQAPGELAKRIGLQSHPDFRIHEAREQVLRKLGTEIDLFVETLTRRKMQQRGSGDGSSVYHFHSTVGAFQNGPGSIANVVQHIESQDKESLLEALSSVRDALATLVDTRDFPKREIIEMVDDARLEVKKPAPNRVKLGSMLATIGETIRVMGSMNSAYQSLKTALLPFGITLP